MAKFLIDSPRVHQWPISGTAEQAITFGRSQVYLPDAEIAEHLQRLEAGQPTMWSYGLSYLDITPQLENT